MGCKVIMCFQCYFAVLTCNAAWNVAWNVACNFTANFAFNVACNKACNVAFNVAFNVTCNVAYSMFSALERFLCLRDFLNYFDRFFNLCLRDFFKKNFKDF